MKVTSEFFVKMSGILSEKYYCRMSKNGDIILSKRPRKVSEKQLECRKKFAEIYAGQSPRRKKKSNN